MEVPWATEKTCGHSPSCTTQIGLALTNEFYLLFPWTPLEHLPSYCSGSSFDLCNLCLMSNLHKERVNI